MKELGLTDETPYLRSASINTFNGMIGLTFSCGGSHDMHFDEFLGKDQSFRIGGTAQGTIQAPDAGERPPVKQHSGIAHR
jgi:hypothetical protein